MGYYETLIKKCESQIQGGQSQLVEQLLARLNFSRVPRESRLPLANICRRAGLYSKGLTLLTRIVQSDGQKIKFIPTSAELAEYAVLLLRSGLVNEAIPMLEKIDSAQVPSALLFRAYGHFMKWEFESAIPCLERYLNASLTPYARLVGLANLGYAYVESRKNEAALRVVDHLIPLTREGSHRQLLGNCLALRAQIHFQEHRLEIAERDLTEARNLFALENTNDHFLIRKWSLIVKSQIEKSLAPLQELKELAIQHRDWEALRECELFGLRIAFSTERFQHLCFGTPYAGFRAKITAELGRFTDRALYVLGPKSSPRFDLRTGRLGGQEFVTPGSKDHRILDVLLRDFYQPLRVGGLFSGLFPDERFNVLSSPNRVFQSIRRARQWIRDKRIPISIVENEGFYSLRIDGNFSFVIPLERGGVDLESLRLNELCANFRKGFFSTKDAQEKLRLSKPTVNRLLNRGLEGGKIERTGDTNRTMLYRISSSDKKAA